MYLATEWVHVRSPHRSNVIRNVCTKFANHLCFEDNGHPSQNLDRNSKHAFIVIFERDNVRNQVMNDETLDFVNFDDYKRLEPNPPLLLFTIKHIHSVFFSRFRPSKTNAYKTSPVLIDQYIWSCQKGLMSDDIDVYRRTQDTCCMHFALHIRRLLQDPLIREDDQEVLWPSGVSWGGRKTVTTSCVQD